MTHLNQTSSSPSDSPLDLENVLLQVKDLSVSYLKDDRLIPAVKKVSFEVQPGEILGLVGESGCGKSTLLHALTRVLPPPGVITGGQVIFKEQNLFSLNETQLRSIRWTEISMVFQSAMNALNPVMTIGDPVSYTHLTLPTICSV